MLDLAVLNEPGVAVYFSNISVCHVYSMRLFCEEPKIMTLLNSIRQIQTYTCKF